MHDPIEDGTDLTRRTLLVIGAMAPALAATGVASASKPAPTASTELPPDLAQAVHDYDRATTRNDIVTLGRLVADDYVLVNSDATLQNKQQYLADFTVPGFRVDPYVLKEPVQKVWGNSAVTGGLLNLSWTLEGRHQRRLLRIAHVWVKQDAHWLLTYTQLTRVPPAGG